MLEVSIVPTIHQLHEDEIYYQQDGAPPHYHHDVRAYLDYNFPDRWIDRRGIAGNPQYSPDLTPLYFNLWGKQKGSEYSSKPATLQELRH
jgi:hypothetical protein